MSEAKFTETKVRGLRKIIAERMSISAHENVAIMLSRAVDVTELMELHEKSKKEAEAKGEKAPSINDMVLKAAALALRKHPALNSTYENGIVRTYEDININMAVAIPNGLMTPVIRNTDSLSVSEIMAVTRDLTDKARTGALAVEDMVGGTFTVTNVGKMKIEVATAIINPPQVAILCVGAVVPRLERLNGEIADRFRLYISLTVDHRIIDGYPASLYLETLCEILEKPDQILE
ncbi:2-oxo acid dehydrogenase subunit E2 [Youngiibacter multivorans]|uniref:Pyruvate dehydrogenase E2 component (Dihydrolipoamide acetyltransferase) n=1 Tax=Youngiibacter multivorans TaxID=937251 RepID=A0ABS4G5T5_9CLOT|nr:2-oxo acid dehydrogenase subunit E2 [Youngiibacter multivorans]MBP1919932.1 pyruvate dehydrogenase E2 component (dihydrolipoamide acetyltransferase) [Youngiibacter multivorans]